MKINLKPFCPDYEGFLVEFLQDGNIASVLWYPKILLTLPIFMIFLFVVLDYNDSNWYNNMFDNNGRYRNEW